jgi:topoisomerase-4 subunit A
MVSNRRAGREFMTVEEGETLLPPVVFAVSAAGKGLRVATASADGRLLLFALDEVKEMTRGRGVVLMGLEKGEKLSAVLVFEGKSLAVSAVGPRGGKEKRLEISGARLEHYAGHRARMGRVLPDKQRAIALALPDKSG